MSAKKIKFLLKIILLDSFKNLLRQQSGNLFQRYKDLSVLIVSKRAKLKQHISATRAVPRHRSIWKLNRHNTFYENELFKNGASFVKENLRIDPESLEELCNLLPNLAKETTQLRETIPLKKRIAGALYALGSSSEYRTIENIFGIGRSTVCEILLEFCSELWKQMKPLYMNSYPLTDAVIKSNVNGFQKLGFPQCIDGCHIEVKPPKEYATQKEYAIFYEKLNQFFYF